jgi:hypothetical protein
LLEFACFDEVASCLEDGYLRACVSGCGGGTTTTTTIAGGTGVCGGLQGFGAPLVWEDWRSVAWGSPTAIRSYPPGLDHKGMI